MPLATSRHPSSAHPVRFQHHDPARSPLLVTWESTRACQLSCAHCRASAIPRRDPRELTTAEAEHLMDQAASFGKPAPIFIITGGDCFERPDLAELVAHGAGLGLHMAVSPSGTPKLTREALAGIHAAGCNVISLSIDGASAATHDAIRRVEQTFDHTVEGWRMARELGIKVQINSVIARHNVEELVDLAALVRDMGAMTWSTFLLVPTGRGTELNELATEEVEDVLNIIYDLGEAVPSKTTEAHHFKRVSVQRAACEAAGADPVEAMHLGPLYQRLRARMHELGLDVSTRRRRAPVTVKGGSGFVFVSHVGDVSPSGFLPVVAGNIRERSLVDLYRDSDLFRGVRDVTNLEGKCGRCEYNTICGGSRARAYAVTGDVYAEEPACAYQPGTFPLREEAAAFLPA